MEIKPTYVTFEQAKWLKEKGFDIPCREGWCVAKLDPYKGRLFPDDTGGKHEIEKPEQWQVVEWLRVNHGIWVYVTPRNSSWIFGAKNLNNWNEHNLINIDFWNTNDYLISKGVPTIMLNPQQAYSAAFDYIKDNNLI